MNLDYYETFKIIYNEGYAMIYLPNHPNASKKGTIYLHTYIMSKHIGRPLTKDECIHHIDGNRLNNEIENLMLFATNSDHVTYHRALQDGSDYILKRIGYVHYCMILHPKHHGNICPVCGGLKSNMGKLCLQCYKKQQHEHIPSRKELKTLIRQYTFTDIGKRYGVSDNAIRKWCKYYNLPFRSREIKCFSNKEWNNV